MQTASFWEIPSCRVFVVELEVGYFQSIVCSTLFKTPAPLLVWFYRCYYQLISSHLLIRNTVYCIFQLLFKWVDAECFKSFSDDLLLPFKELLQIRYILLEAEVEHFLSWITVFCVESLTLSNKFTMKPLCQM